MRFYGRQEEIESLRSALKRSNETSQFTVVMGKRRIGKTWTIQEAYRGTRSVFFTITRVSEPVLCMNLQNVARDAGIDLYGRIETVKDLLIALMAQARETPLTVVFDEFQELQYVNKAAYGDIQAVWDAYSRTSHLNLVVSGSVHSMMVRLFEDDREPLFNRPTSKIELRPFTIRLMKEILKEHNQGYTNSDLLALYILTGGVPYYIGILMDSGGTDKASMMDRALSMGSRFLSDGKDVLITEFGKDYMTYFAIMQAVSQGRERRKEIEDMTGSDAGPYLDRLMNEYAFVDQIAPVLSKPNSKTTRWVISDMYLRFYFNFIFPNQSLIEVGRFDLLKRIVSSGSEEYEGRALEDYFRRRIAEEDTWTELGGWWNRNGTIEIDIVVIDSLERKARLIEVKRNPDKYRRNDLIAKGDAIAGKLEGYEISYQGLSMEDMRSQRTMHESRLGTTRVSQTVQAVP